MTFDNTIALSVAIFAFAFLGEMAYVQWTIAAVAGKAGRAAVFSGLIQLVGIIAVLCVVSSPLLLIPAVIGHVMGSYIAVRHG